MKWVCIGVCTSLLSAASSVRADEQARTVVDQAFARQRALPGYVEHQFGRMPVMPGAAETLADAVGDRLKAKATEKVREKIGRATAGSPLAAEVSERAMARLDAQADDVKLELTLGPEQEIVTIEHAGERQRLLMAGGGSEVVRGGGQMAYKFAVPLQQTAIQLAATVESAAEVAREAKSTVASIKALSNAIAKAGTGDILSAAIGAFDEITRLLGSARTTADLAQATLMLERVSDVWHCQPDSAPPTPPQLVAVEPLADETIGSDPTHSYFATWAFGSAQAGYQIESRVWLRVSDGLPLRSELSLPNGQTVRLEYDYPASVPVPMPMCAAPPS